MARGLVLMWRLSRDGGLRKQAKPQFDATLRSRSRRQRWSSASPNDDSDPPHQGVPAFHLPFVSSQLPFLPDVFDVRAHRDRAPRSLPGRLAGSEENRTMSPMEPRGSRPGPLIGFHSSGAAITMARVSLIRVRVVDRRVKTTTTPGATGVETSQVF